MAYRHPSPAKGWRKGDLLKCVIALDVDTFEEVRARAVKNKTSFAHEARQLIEWGLMAEDETR